MKRLVLLLVGGLFLGTSTFPKGDKSFESALEAAQRGDFDEALKLFEEALDRAADNLRFGSEYRMAVIQSQQFDRAIEFLEGLVDRNPGAAHAFLNLGFAHVDKIPVAGSISQVILANSALKYFTRSLEVRPTWIGYYTRGNSYLFWPKVFNKTPLAVDDLEKALELQLAVPAKPYHARTYVALGDAHLKLDRFEEARRVWGEGLSKFPSNQSLQLRLEAAATELDEVTGSEYDPNRRVDTNLKELWKGR